MTENLSPAQILAAMPEEAREEYFSKLSPEALAALKYNWDFWARPNQREPEGDWWNTWFILAGRGFGKTRTGAQWVSNIARNNPGCRIALIAETAADARKVMVEGESGILAISPPDFTPTYAPTNREVRWPNGATATTYNATEPDQLRGPQHHFAWCDELAKWDYAQEMWDQLQFGLRLGSRPRTLVTTTPRPIPLVRKLVNDPFVAVTRGATRDNACNMPASFIREIEDKYGGTRLGRQELEGEILEDIPGALWNREMLDSGRIKEAPELDRVVIAVDPAASSEEGADETGIVGVGLARDGEGFAKGYLLADRSLRGSPEEWARAAVRLYRELEADKIVAEKNQGGEMVAAVIRAVDRSIPVTLVSATRGKHVRAEPISALYEQGRVHHVGRFDKLEDQMCLFSIDNLRTPSMGSPDRVDALVWGMTELFDKITGRRRGKKVEGATTPKRYKTPSVLPGVKTGWMVG